MTKARTLPAPKRKLPRLSTAAVDWIVLSLILTILALQAFNH